MTSIKELKKEIELIKERNRRVEKDKAWETSWSRRMTIVILTYLVVVSFFLIAKLPNPWVNALIPAVAFLLSTMTVPLVKSVWLKDR